MSKWERDNLRGRFVSTSPFLPHKILVVLFLGLLLPCLLHKKSRSTPKGHSVFNNSTWLPSGRTYTSMKILSTTLRLCNPLLLDEQNNTLDLSIQVLDILDMESYNKYREGKQ